MFRSLMTAKRFAPLFWTQFFSAFNDNFLKNALVFLILYGAATGVDPVHSGVLVTLASALFIVPFFFLSGLAGQLADRHDKARVAQRLKLSEVGAAGVAVVGFALHSVPILFFAVLLFGLIAALFGPIKYGILPDHLAREELPAGNALVEGATFLAILLGTIFAGLAGAGGGSAVVFATAVLGFAALCYAASRAIPSTGEAAPTLGVDINVVRSTIGVIRHAWADTAIWRTGLMVAWFWAAGIVVVALLPSLVKNTLGGSEQVVTVFLAVFSVGVAIGSGLAAWLAHGRIILLPTPLASMAMAIFLADIGIATLGLGASVEEVGVATFFLDGRSLHMAIDFFAVAVCGGLFVVPAFAAVQAWSEPEQRARVIAGVNVVSAGFMVVATLGTAALQNYGVSTAALFLTAGGLCLIAGLVIFRFLPTSPIRDFLSIVFRAFYRLEVHGTENFAKAGPNMIVALNHVSFLDAALAFSILDRDPVFAIDQWIARRWWVRPWLRFVNAMPLDPRHPLSTRTLINVVRQGKTLVIFPEGRLTATGSLMKVYDGAGLVADKSDAMIVPVRIDGLEQTPFTRLDPSQVRRRWWPKVIVTVLEPVKLTIAPEFRGKHRRAAAGAALYQIMSDLVFRTTATNCTVPEALIAAARKHGLEHIVLEDPTSGELSYKKLLVGISALGRKLMALAREGGAVGVMLPNANGAAATVLGLMSAGRVPAMINFSAGADSILAACKAANVTVIVTSKAFVEKARLTDLVDTLRANLNVVMLEEVRKSIGLVDKVRALLNAKRTLVKRLPDDPAAILFTSGSEGTPKGVVLSHRNMLANAAQGAARIEFGRPDKVFNVLPVFHSFGLTVGLILPLVSGVRVYLYPSPLHYRIVPELIYASNATILFGTDTFLTGYARSAHAYDFRSLRYILAGAEPVKPSTRHLYMEKFGIRILEGYGVTETAPALALNTPMFSREGTVGRFLPGIEVQLEPVAGVDGGRLFVRGPNVMLGYLRTDKPGVLEPPVGGWHDTGDIVTIDSDGFVTIVGRAKRFAKVGGEMISLAAIEALAADLWQEASSAVVSIPDERKGERLILLTEQVGANRSELHAFAKERGVSEVFVPAEVRVVSELPLLGSGKIDHPAVARMFAAFTENSGRGIGSTIDRLNLSTDASLMFPPGPARVVGFDLANRG